MPLVGSAEQATKNMLQKPERNTRHGFQDVPGSIIDITVSAYVTGIVIRHYLGILRWIQMQQTCTQILIHDFQNASNPEFQGLLKPLRSVPSQPSVCATAFSDDDLLHIQALCLIENAFGNAFCPRDVAQKYSIIRGKGVFTSLHLILYS